MRVVRVSMGLELVFGGNWLVSVSGLSFGGCEFEVMQQIERDSGFLREGFPEVLSRVGRWG